MSESFGTMFLLVGVCLALAMGPDSSGNVTNLLNRAQNYHSNSEFEAAYDSIGRARTQALELEKKVQDQHLEIARAIFSKRDPANWFITQDGKPTDGLIALLTMDNLYDAEDRLPKIVAKTQKAWVKVEQGRGGKERTDLQDSEKQQKIQELAEQIVKDIGLFDDRPPALTHYDYGVCYGGFLGGVRSKLFAFVEAWKKGIRFDSLVFLTGERSLRKGEDGQDSVTELTDQTKSPLKFKPGWSLKENTPYETEYDLCKLVWEQSEIPEDMREALRDKVIFVNAPRPEGQERPGTKDTYRTWRKEHNPEPGTILAFSYPLIWSYQHFAAKNCLDGKYPLDTCSPEVSRELLVQHKRRLVSLVQDTVAKCLYELAEQQQIDGY